MLSSKGSNLLVNNGTLTSATASNLASTSASATSLTSCTLLLVLLDLGLVTRMQEIWGILFAATIITWEFSLGNFVPMVRWDVPLVGNF